MMEQLQQKAEGLGEVGEWLSTAGTQGSPDWTRSPPGDARWVRAGAASSARSYRSCHLSWLTRSMSDTSRKPRSEDEQPWIVAASSVSQNG